jgi:hypothetical protein
MKTAVLTLLAVILGALSFVWACHPVLKCVEPAEGGYRAYFGFEGGEDRLPIGSNNKFTGGIGCVSSGKDCGQGSQFKNNGPFEADLFGPDSIVVGKSRLPVQFLTSVTWTLSG